MKKTYCFVLLLLTVVVCVTFAAPAESFRNPVRIPTDSDPVGVFVVDLNHDGLPDILWGGYGATTSSPGILHTLLAQSSGGYLPGPTMTMPANVSSVCVPADETGDGIVDIVCPSAYQFSASIYTFPGKGDGSFGSPIITQIPSLPNNGAWVSLVFLPVTDLNGDGIADLLVADAQTQSGYVMLGDGHGSFTKSSSITNIYGVPQVMDINSDGNVDLLFANGGIWLGKGDGTFTQSPFVPSFPFTSRCVFHDMDNDGKPDAVCGLQETVTGDIIGGTQLLIFHGNGDGSFAPTPIKTITYGDHSNEFNGFGTFQFPIFVQDINGDGTPDILAYSGDGLAVILNRGGLQFDDPTHYATGNFPWTIVAGVNAYTMQLADIDNDGFPDLVSTGPNGIYISNNQKDGTFNAAPAYEVTQVIGYQTVADFNEDGIPDIAATGDQSIEINIGKGDGTFQARVALPSSGIDFSTPLSTTNARILHGDFNGDHHQDILAIGSSATYQYDSYVLFGDGTGSFSSPQLVPNTSSNFSIYDSRVALDINHDGRDDLFSNDYSHLYVYLSNGDGTFTTTTTTVSPNSSQDQNGVHSIPALADFDHDGKLDAVWAAGANVTICKGHGDGTFDANAVTVPIPTSVFSSWIGADVTTGDFDGDGNQDFALLLEQQNPLLVLPGAAISAAFVFYGDGHGNFTPGTLAGTFNRVYTEIYAADLSNQGLEDLILKTGGGFFEAYAVGIVNSLPKRTFDSEVNYVAGSGISDLSIADLNHDGFLDLVFSNGDYNIRASSVTVLMNQGNPPVTGTLTITPEPSEYGQPLTFDATLVPSSFTPVTGTMTFTLDGTSLGSAPISDNKASFSVSTSVLPGTHSLTASWPGNAIYSAVTLSATHHVEPIPSSITLSSSLNPAPLDGNITFTASISPAVVGVDSSGTVTFFDGQTQLSAPVSIATGQPATITTSNLGVGSHSITAVYSGNSQVQGSTSSVLTESVVFFVGGFSIQSTPTTATVTAGQSATFQLAITASGGFSAPLSFSCSGLPAQATCVFSPSTLSMGQGQVALSIHTVGSTQSASLIQSPSLTTTGATAILAGLVFCFLPSASRRKRFVSFLVLAIFGFVTLITTSCGGGSGHGTTGSTSPVSYQVSVTAQTTEPSQNISHSSVITLTVQ
jgi:Bacterial Ig-like domain (group 3)/FG-GAP-like repeat